MDMNSALGIKHIHSVEFVVDYFDRSEYFYLNQMGFNETHQSTPIWEERFRSKAVYFASNSIRIMVSTPLSNNSYTAQYLKILCPGIRKITFLVVDLARAIDYLSNHHATFIHKTIEVESNRSRHRLISIASPIGFLEFAFLQINGDEEDIPLFENVAPTPHAGSFFKTIDHMTINARTIYPIYNFFSHVMDLKNFWSVSFHTPDSPSGRKGTGLSSQVMHDPASGIKFASNEPLFPHFNDSQIQTFVEKNHGAGIQHIALGVENILNVVEVLKSRNLEFLETPDKYYDLLPDRLTELNITKMEEDIADLKKLGILVDGRDDKYILQIFLKDASMLYHEENAGPFFYEIIQRKGHPGFGEGNFRALFEAIESQEALR
jgi:4-hydroxyphenylpyruvate dioxygenase